MSERAFEEFLYELLEKAAADPDYEPVVRSTATFGDVGMLTRNRGLVVRLQNGAEFQITIVQSQEAKGAEDEEEEGA